MKLPNNPTVIIITFKLWASQAHNCKNVHRLAFILPRKPPCVPQNGVVNAYQTLGPRERNSPVPNAAVKSQEAKTRQLYNPLICC